MFLSINSFSNPCFGTIPVCKFQVFWAFTEGAVVRRLGVLPIMFLYLHPLSNPCFCTVLVRKFQATALLVSGGNSALRGLQAASILSGLPFTLLLVFMCMSIIRMCSRAEQNNQDDNEVSLQQDYAHSRVFGLPVFGGVFNVFEHIISLGSVHPKRLEVMPFPTSARISNFFMAGSYTYQDYLDSMEGATRSGLMVANEIIARADGPDGLKSLARAGGKKVPFFLQNA